ncbi:hypothetical protein [Chryseobacterium indoltheticum]|uniref:hypothetical protein n=1 Tax=Chryseobacterium indoltheticum TaxID=254 RepID=UPI003F49817E
MYERKYYRYSKIRITVFTTLRRTKNDLKAMNNAIQILKQFQRFFDVLKAKMNGVFIQKLEDSIHSTSQKSIIHLDKNEQLKGLEHIDVLYESILNKKRLKDLL